MSDSRRYCRQTPLSGFGAEGQARLADSAVTVRGTGEAASTAARYLVGAGLGAVYLDSSEGPGLTALNPEPKLGPTSAAPRDAWVVDPHGSRALLLGDGIVIDPPEELLGALAAAHALVTLLGVEPGSGGLS